ncbi:MAG: N-6 DNA methylase [Calothrix sp. SM1_5_4]|nr:N-6 DNA methylase [Calothrix sp. SM1_5_4]
MTAPLTIWRSKKGQWSSANLKSDKMKAKDIPKVRKGQLFFTPDNEDRKATGSYYTPDCVVQFILGQTVGVQVKGKTSDEILKMKICDPAMGSSHFLGGALNYLARIYLTRLFSELNDDLNVSFIEAKQRILHNCIFGVDINDRAVKLAKLSLWMESASPKSSLESLNDQLKNGNSVLDEKIWSEWGFLKKGLDAVIGNPPYLGEKGRKEMFQELATGWLGKRFYQRKVDLFYLFFHLGLDILKDGGRLGFITTNYFPTATGATKLRKDFSERSTMRLLMNLNEVRVFGDAAGQHNMITVVSKGKDSAPCLSISTTEKSKISEDLLVKILAGENGSTREIPQADLFDGDEHYIRLGAVDIGKVSGDVIESALNKVKLKGRTLGELVNVNQGIVSGCDKVSNRHLKMFPALKAKKGEGIFVLTDAEVKELGLSKQDRAALVRPFFKNSDIGRFSVEEKNSLWLLFSNHIRSLSDYPSIREHFTKFKTILTSRAQMEHCLDWWDLHQIRMKDKNKTGEIKKMIFDGPKIVSPQRSKLNKFAISNGPWYASADVYYITPAGNDSPPLEYLLGLLNSKLYMAWLYFRGKRKGEMLELYQKPLSEVPVHDLDKSMVAAIVKQVDKLSKDSENKLAYEELNQIIYRAYGLTKGEISAIEAFYESRKNLISSSEDDGSEDSDAA